MGQKIRAIITFNNDKSVRLLLRPDVAPESVRNFTELAESGFFNGLCMHRVIPGFMIQGGGMLWADGTLYQKNAPKTIAGEFEANGRPNPLSHKPGVISMARTSDPNSASSQFFICVDDCTFLDGQYAAFGEAEDLDSIRTAVRISCVPTRSVGWYDDVPVEPVIISSVEIIRQEEE